MFNFTTTTVINSDTDLQSGKPMFSAQKDEKGNHGAILKIKRDFTFEMPGITKIYVRKGSEPKKALLRVNCAKIVQNPSEIADYPIACRLAINVALEGSEESVFANDFYQKGMPFSIGFTLDADDRNKDISKEIVDAINRYNIGTVGRKIFTARRSKKEGAVFIEATSEYIRFRSVAVMADLGHRWETITRLDNGQTGDKDELECLVIKERGVNGFGTFSHLIKDLRLPTADNTSWTALHREERPLFNELYDQYIIYYEAPSMTNPSLAAVGHETKTRTTHVFWVRQSLSTNFESVITEVIGPCNGPHENEHDKLFELVNPEKAH